MRILHINRELGIGGGVTYIRSLARLQKEQGHWVGILAGPGAMASVLKHECDELKISHVFHAIQRPFLKRYLKEHRIDVVDAHSYTQAKVIFPICKALGIKTVITPHGARTPKRLKELAPMFKSCDGIMVIDEQLARLYYKEGVPLQRLFLSRLF